MNDLDELEKKISEAAQSKEEPVNHDAQNKNDGMQIASEFLSYVIAGVFLGFLADKYLGSAPWGIIVLPVLGLVMGVYRANQAQNKR